MVSALVHAFVLVFGLASGHMFVLVLVLDQTPVHAAALLPRPPHCARCGPGSRVVARMKLSKPVRDGNPTLDA